MSNTRNVIKYFEKIECDFLKINNLSPEECLAYLNKIFMSHILFFPFHNFELREASQAHPLYRKNLSLFKMKQFVQGHNGGFCFQNTQLLYQALKSTGFNVYRSVAKVLNDLAPDSIEASKLPATHLILVATIDNHNYLLDPSMGMNGHSAPFLIQSSLIHKQNNRYFKIDKMEDNFLFYRAVNGKWFLSFCSSLLPADSSSISTQLTKLQCFPDVLGIRDIIILVGIATNTGGKSLLWNSTTNIFTFKTISTTDADRDEKLNVNDAFNQMKRIHPGEWISGYTEGNDVHRGRVSFAPLHFAHSNFCCCVGW